jgi:hypothetical protein
LLLGGAAVYRCDKRPIFTAALAAEVVAIFLIQFAEQLDVGLLLGGAAVYRCEKRLIFIAAFSR